MMDGSASAAATSATPREAGLFLVVGLGVGAALLFVPLVHILGILFALALTGVAGLRLRAARVLEAARGVCPNCREGPFYVGFGRRGSGCPPRGRVRRAAFS